MLICIDSEVGLALAEQDAITAGAKVINESLTWYNTSRGDGSGGPGTPDAIAADARAHGILWVNAAGNDAERHWGGPYNPWILDPDLNSFGSNGPQDLVVLQSGETGCAYLKWDDWPVTTEDFDLALVREAPDLDLSDSTPVAFSSGDQAGGPSPPVEQLCYTNNGAGATFGLVIVRYSAVTNARLDLYWLSDSGSGLEYVGNDATPEPASSPSVLSVGAYCWANRQTEPYSSSGTVDGRIKPDLLAPDSISTQTYGSYSASSGCGSSGFAGTSASSPEVAGMAALLSGHDPALNGDQLEAALESPTVDPQVGTDRPAWMPLLGGYERDSQDSGVYPDLTPDGSRLAFISNRIANCTIDLVVRQTGVASCAVTSAAVVPFALTPDAQNVAYVTGNLVGNRDVHVQAIGGADTDVSVSSASVAANAASSNPSISDDGRYVAFVTDASNLVSGDTNGCPTSSYATRSRGRRPAVSVDSSGGQGNGASFNAEISGNGRYVVFVSSASNLVAGDSNGAADVFVHDLQTGATTRVDVTSGGAQTAFGVSTGNDEGPSIDATGRHVAFLSQAGDLVAGDAAGSPDIFVHDLQTGATTLESLSTQGIRIQAAHGPSLSANGRYLTFQATHDDYNGSAERLCARRPGPSDRHHRLRRRRPRSRATRAGLERRRVDRVRRLGSVRSSGLRLPQRPSRRLRLRPVGHIGHSAGTARWVQLGWNRVDRRHARRRRRRQGETAARDRDQPHLHLPVGALRRRGHPLQLHPQRCSGARIDSLQPTRARGLRHS